MIGFWRFREFTYEVYHNVATDVADIAKLYIDGDTITSYLETGVTDEAYDEMAQNLHNLCESKITSAIYICVPDAETMTIANIFDTRIADAEDPTPYMLGAVDMIGVKNPQTLIDVYKTGIESDDYYVRKTSYGYNASSIEPIFNSAGESVALIVVDVPMRLLHNTLDEYLFFSVTASMVVEVLFVFFFMYFLRIIIIKPLHLITQETKSFVEEETQVSNKFLSVQTGDEIENLARSIYQLELDTNEYIENLTTMAAENQRISTELSVARDIQAALLPAVRPWPFPDRRDFDISAIMAPAKEVGGDFYDFFFIDSDHLAVVIGDVSGKSVPGSLFMVKTKTLLKDRALSGASPSEIFNRVNNALCEVNGAELFVTCWMGIYEFSTRKLTFANAGHNQPLIMQDNGNFRFLKYRPNLVLAGMENTRYRQGELTMNVGDTLFLYTDGVTEATFDPETKDMHIDKYLFGEEKLRQVLNLTPGASPEKLIHIVKDSVDAFVKGAPQFDDITMLVLKVKQ